MGVSKCDAMEHAATPKVLVKTRPCESLACAVAEKPYAIKAVGARWEVVWRRNPQ